MSSQTLERATSSADKELSLEKLTQCPYCQSGNVKLWTIGRDRAHRLVDQAFAYTRCGDCETVFLADRPAENEISRFYPTDYLPYQATSNTEIAGQGAVRKPNRRVDKFNRRLENLWWNPYRTACARYYNGPPPDGRFLDFGCGSGKFLNTALAKGWKTIGIDFSPEMLDTIKANGHEAYLAGPEVWSRIADDSLDFIRMNQVVEHLYDPKPIMASLYRKLKPGGRIHVATPNPASWSSHLLKTYWFGLECPRHIMLFPSPTLQRMLEEAGFRQVEVVNETITKDLARGIGYWLSARGLFPEARVETLRHNPVLNLLLGPFCMLATGMKRSERGHVFAVK